MILLFLMMMFLAGWPWSFRRADRDADRAAAIRANNRGIVLIEQFRTLDAIPAFEEAVRLDPNWLPARINLGIALLIAWGDDPGQLSRNRKIFEQVLRRDPDNPYAHFCLGMLLMYQKDGQEAIGHFQAVLNKDANDAYSWYWLGSLMTESDERTECFRQALTLNRNLSSAGYRLAMSDHLKKPEIAGALLEEHEALGKADWETRATMRYGEMGPYAEVIGDVSKPDDRPRIGPLSRFHTRELKIQFAAGARWATAADLGEDAVAKVRRLVRERFGATLVVLDYNRDGRVDLFLAGAVVENGQVRDLLLRQDPDGQFTDVTAEAGLSEPRPTLGCVVADFDNDHWPDLLLTGAGVQKLFRNSGAGSFEDLSVNAGLDKLTSVCLGGSIIDLNHDGKLDLLICEYAVTTRSALESLKGEWIPGGLIVFLNEGTAPHVKQDAKLAALTCAFQRTRIVAGLKEEVSGLTNVAASDIDRDGDLDLFVTSDHDSPMILRNDRLLRFHRQNLPASIVPTGAWNGALVLDANHDGRSDLFLVGARQAPRLLINRGPIADEEEAPWHTVQPNGAPSLRQAIAADIDLDSWTDVIGLSEEGKLIQLHNKGGRLRLEADGLGSDLPGDVMALTVCDLNRDDAPDVILWSESGGLLLCENQGNGNHGLSLELSCSTRRDPGSGNLVRCSADSFGTRVTVHAEAISMGQELTTSSAGLGQSRQPLLLGMGRSSRADAVRLRWPDGTRQAEGPLLAGRRNFIEWTQRRIFW
jgi:hypothetical protein